MIKVSGYVPLALGCGGTMALDLVIFAHHEDLGCEVTMGTCTSVSIIFFFAEKNGGNEIKCSITNQWEGNLLNIFLIFSTIPTINKKLKISL